jgi:hypothetical protein
LPQGQSSSACRFVVVAKAEPATLLERVDDTGTRYFAETTASSMNLMFRWLQPDNKRNA